MGMGMEVAGLYTTLTQADEAFVAACKSDATALEEVAVASQSTTAKVKAGAAEQAAAVEASAAEQVVATEASRGRMATAWSSFTTGVGRQWTSLTGTVKSGMADIGKGIEKEAATGEKAWAKISKAGEISALALAGIGFESVKMAGDFQSSMALIATQAGAGQKEVQALSSQVLALAPTVGMGPDALAEGLYHIESAGFRGAEAMQILAAASKDAAIGQSDLESTSQALVGVMASGIGGVKDAADAAAYLNTTVGIGDMRMEKLAAAISTGVLPSFVSAGLKMNDFSASLATLTDNVTPADEAATRLRMTVALMAAPSHQAMKALTAIGLGSDEAGKALNNRDAELKKYGITVARLAQDMQAPNGLLVATMDLKSHLAGLSQPAQAAVLEKAFGGGKTSGAIMTLINESDRLKSKYEAIGDTSSRAQAMQESWAGTQATFKQQLHDVGAQAAVIGINIGNWLLPPLTKLFGFLAAHSGVMKVFFAILVAGMVAFTAAVVANTIAMLANPAVWIVIAIVAAVALLGFAIYELVTHWSTVWNWIKNIALTVWHWLVDAWHATVDWLAKLWDNVWGAIKDSALAVWHWLVDAWHATINALEVAAQWVLTKIIYPIVRWMNDYLVAPFKIVLKGIQVIWEFAWGFLSVVIARFRKGWDVLWAGVTMILHWAWDNVIKPILGFITRYGIVPLLTAIGILKLEWNLTWEAIGKAASATWDFLKVVWGYIYEDGIKPIERAVSWLGDRWADVWGGIKTGASAVWDFLKMVWGYVYEDGIKPIERAVSWLGDRWSALWDGIKSVVSGVWDHIKPIFDKISGAIDRVTGDLKGIVNSPGKAGQAFAKMLGFDQGGWVPGAEGAPMMAVVHGGEFVVSRDMLAGRAATPIQVGRSAGSVGAGTPAPSIVHSHVHVYLDGKELQDTTMKNANRHKARNVTNGYGG